MKEQLAKAVNFIIVESDRMQVSPLARFGDQLTEGLVVVLGVSAVVEGNIVMGSVAIASGAGIEITRRLADRALEKKYQKPLRKIWEQLKSS